MSKVMNSGLSLNIHVTVAFTYKYIPLQSLGRLPRLASELEAEKERETKKGKLPNLLLETKEGGIKTLHTTHSNMIALGFSTEHA